MPPLLIFDLDGTLIDSRLDLTHAVNAMLRHMHREPLPEKTVAALVGNGAPVLVRKALGDGVSDDDVATGLTFFLRYYAEHKLDYTVLYPGVREALEAFIGRDAALSVLTNKPERISCEIIEGLGLGGLFFRVYGGNSFDFKKPHPIGITRLMAEADCDADNTIMVGDSYVDVRTARNAGVRCCGVSYGFQPESLVADPPDMMVDSLGDLIAYLNQI